MGGGQIRFTEFVLDQQVAELRRNSKIVAVEPQVFDLIVYLAENPGKIVSRDDLIANVWQGRIVSDAAISTRINAARKALGDDGTRQAVIKTIQRRGFRFLPEVEISSEPVGEEPVGKDGAGTSASWADITDIRYCQAEDGVSLAYAAVGNGPPLVKAANFLTHLEIESKSPVWRHWFKALAARHRYIRYDVRGNGLSDWQVPDISFDTFVTDLKAIVDELALDRFSLIGLSQGAAVAIEFAVRYPERVSCLILVGGYPAGWNRLGNEEFSSKRNAMLELIRTGWGADNPAFRQAYTSLFVPDGTPEQHSWFNELQKVTATPENAYRIMLAGADIDIRDSLSKVSQPTLVAHCRADAVVPFEAGRQLAAHIPNAQFLPLDGNNHIVLESDACWPEFLDTVNRFLAENGS
ncbi:MAG: alpha/beta fold hydrolase [Alphaproteobacteria bacterium]